MPYTTSSATYKGCLKDRTGQTEISYINLMLTSQILGKMNTFYLKHLPLILPLFNAMDPHPASTGPCGEREIMRGWQRTYQHQQLHWFITR